MERFGCGVLKVLEIVLDSSMVEHSAVNRVVVGSSPTRGVWEARETCGRDRRKQGERVSGEA